MPLWQVIALLIAAAAASVVLAGVRMRQITVSRLTLWVSILFVGICVGVGLVNAKLLSLATEEDNVIEWLTAICLLLAACIAFSAAIRLHRQGRPSPVAMILAVGFAWAFTRELEYGGDLFDGQFWFTRNIFHPQSFASVAYFERFKEQMHLHYDALTLYVVHLCFTAAAVAVAILLVRYVIRHRSVARQEMKRFLRVLHCRLFLLGAGLYVAAELVGGALHRLPQWQVFHSFTQYHGDLYHRIVEESLECWGSMVLWFCALALWQAARPEVIQPSPEESASSSSGAP